MRLLSLKLPFLFMVFSLLCISGLPTPQHTVNYKQVDIGLGIELDVAFAGNPAGSHVVLLLHGYPENSWFWRGLIDPLLDDGTIGSEVLMIMPDQRGYNHSTKPEGIMQYNASFLMEDMVRLVKPYAQKIPTGKIHVVGHDWGGPIAWMFAGFHPELTASLTIMNGPHPSVFDNLLRHNPLQQLRSQYMIYFDTQAATDETNAKTLASMFEGESWFDPITKAVYMAAWPDKHTVDSGLNWYRANVFSGKMNVPKFTPTMNSSMPKNLTITPPTLVLWGMKDTAFNNDANLDGLTDFVPTLTIKKYPTTAHWIAQEQAKPVAADIASFIANFTTIF